MSDPRILLFDIETAPSKGYYWRRFDQNISQDMVIQESHMLTYAYKWLGEKKVYHDRLDNWLPLDKVGDGDDGMLLAGLWKLLDEADLTISHYGKRFDHVYSNARFLKHGLRPPSPFKMIDTKEAASRYFKFPSNKLNDLGQYLGLGKKVDHEGFMLWRKCLEGDQKAWDKMVKYNIQDVNLLEKVYLEMRPYITNHPNLSSYTEKECCPKCGSEDTEKRGFARTLAGKYQRYLCKSCGGWHRGRTNVLTKEERACVVANVA